MCVCIYIYIMYYFKHLQKLNKYVIFNASIELSINNYTHIRKHTYAYTYACTHKYTHTYINRLTNIHTYTHTHIYKHVYVHTQRTRPWRNG